MRVTGLKLWNFRAIEAAEFSFQPGFNLVVGVNGVGKTSVLDALRVCFSRILPGISASRSKAMSFEISDIRVGFPFLDVEASLEVGNEQFRFARRQWGESFARDDAKNIDQLRREILDTERLRGRARNLLRELEESHGVTDTDTFDPSSSELRRKVRSSLTAPNCVFFSTNRAVISHAVASKSKAVGGPPAAYADALAVRPLHLRQIAEWMRAQSALASEQRSAARYLEVLQEAVARFLPDYRHLRPSDENGTRLLLDHAGIVLDVGQLSDGERGVLALVLDLARRLSQANPVLDDPLRSAEAVVLIDEIDLHLHPKWQRQIVRNLIAAFPRCQFIATTHSPQVIGEVAHDRIQIIADGRVYSPTHSFGVDSSRVLEEIMSVDPRAQEVQELLSRISKEVGNHRFEQARSLVSDLSVRVGENDPEVARARALIDFMEGKD